MSRSFLELFKLLLQFSYPADDQNFVEKTWKY